ncbi:MAG: hypothetical protein K9L70_16070, partial [Thiohalocapsa sp.]|nr:hypothetical protein [Thiohalocapsa sp.]
MPTLTVADLPRSGPALEEALEPFCRGDFDALETLLAARLAQDPLAVLKVLHDSLFAERAVAAYPFSLWLLERRDLLAKNPRDQALLDLGLASVVYRWRADAVRTFLDLGADPNRALIERRTALDICANRLNFFYSEPKDDLEAAVAALTAAGGKGWVEATLGPRVSATGVFEALDTYDSWPETAVRDLGGLDPETQAAWAEVLTHCAVTA